MKEKKHYEAIHRTYEVEGDLSYCLDVFGDELAKRQGYKDIDGMEAVDFYLINKFHWLPSQVRAMTPEDKRFVLTEEMSGFVLPAAARTRRVK
ncbi:MAG: hypothetical protein QOK48_595 [Blastocatellia bacterium]|jgi:hypothetical protein|nr:hypothetical protein [Blastocatellia bacterium]